MPKIMPKIMKFSRLYKKEDTIIDIKGVKIGGGNFIVAAGPCAIESKESYYKTARAVKKAGANIIRGSAFKPRTSPYSFQGLGIEGLKIIKALGEELDIVVETEVLDPRYVEITAENVDILRVGARNMQNYELLKELSKIDKPIILKRGMSSTIDEWLNSAEYLMSNGNMNIILCERGIRTFEKTNRNTLDLSTIPVIKKKTHLPIIVDPSHATGRRELILPVCKAAIASNADGLLIEVHCCPEEAKSDGKQSLTLEDFKELMIEIEPYLNMEKKTMPTLLKGIREQITDIDSKIINLLADRISTIPEIVEYKKKNKLPIFQPKREEKLLSMHQNLAVKRKINPKLVEKFFQLIIDEMKKLQQKKMDETTGETKK